MRNREYSPSKRIKNWHRGSGVPLKSFAARLTGDDAEVCADWVANKAATRRGASQ